ncbi:hypothetical protein ACU5B6_20140 [Moritella viscosa]|uniref:hypothetical protein n=1 Tax=Moritella viscosa TaxID=80854 RepID=UPI00091D863A|nr:hypothetical protein [Moritella viscosa]SHO08894.1 Putative uncharacterized protein [Moritella viscosa]
MLSSNGFIIRRTVDIDIYDLNLELRNQTIEILDYSSVRIKFKHKRHPVDLGILCYINYFFEKKGKVDIGCLVDASSLIVHRKVCIKNIIEWAYTSLKLGLRESSLMIKLNRFRLFMNWCDKEGLTDVLKNFAEAKDSFSAYLKHQKELLRLETISLSTAANNQNMVMEILSEALCFESIKLGIGNNLLKKSHVTVNNTTVPLHHAVKNQVRTYHCIFEQFTRILIDNKPLPQRISIPQEFFWLMPCDKIFATELMLNSRSEWKQGYWGYDYLNGKIASPSNITQYYKGKYAVYVAKNSVKNANEKLIDVNTNPYHYIRHDIYVYSIYAFINLFLANTGMNLSQVLLLRWSDEYDLDKIEQGFRTIKYRAGDKKQEFRITSNFLQTFKLFLRLRSYALEGREVDYLFFLPTRCRHDRILNFNKISSKNFSQRMKEQKWSDLFSGEPITSRGWRAFKADVILTETKGDIHTTATILQNSSETVMSSYANGTETESAKQFGLFYSKLKLHINNDPTVLGGKELSVGQCKKPDNPQAELNAPATPNCKQEEYCLFCDQYAVHADGTDIRKLLSLKYIILETKELSETQELFEDTFRNVLERIDQIINAIADTSESNKSLVDDIIIEVDNEQLSPYWQHVLDNLVIIGAVL